VDILRGAIMVVMALDHTRDYFHQGAGVFDPTDLSQSSPAVFLTRWITHFCAPGFLFLAGLSARLKASTTTRKELSWYLFTRGLWLMLLDVTVFRFALLFTFYTDTILISILWLIGSCMVLMSGLIFLRHWAIAVVAMVIIFGHNLADGLSVAPESGLYIPWVFLMAGGPIQLSSTSMVFVIYATIPWLGIMALGYWIGQWYDQRYTARMRRRLLFNAGILFVILFLFFRYTGFYGDPRPVVDYPADVTSFLSFLNVTKYPVSLQFTLMTLGPLMILLGLLEKVEGSRSNPLLVFGRVPLFYFLLHFFVIHLAALIMYMIRTGKALGEIDFPFPASLGGPTADGAVSLPWVYVAWVSVVLGLYPLCRWFDAFRREGGRSWAKWL
jgi:uncharacterized membrane protein